MTPRIIRRSLRYALTGPVALANWRENRHPASLFPGRDADLIHRTWCMELGDTVTATGERTRRPTVQGARCFTDLRVHWAYLCRIDATPYDIDEALDAEQALIAHINDNWPMSVVPAWAALDGAKGGDVGQPVGGVNIHWVSMQRAERPIADSDEIVAVVVHGQLLLQVQHSYDWS